jgi:hypothetical protein
MRKVLGGAAVAMAAIAMSAAPAFAHECYNASRSAKGNASIATHSPSFVSLGTIALEFFTTPAPDGLGLCDAGATWLIGQIDANSATLGVSSNTVISTRVVQAGGIDNSPNARATANQGNGKGIDHLEENPALDPFIGAHIEEAAALC